MTVCKNTRQFEIPLKSINLKDSSLMLLFYEIIPDIESVYLTIF